MSYKLYGLVLAVTLVLDGVWLGTMVSRVYRPRLSGLFQLETQIPPAIIFYLLFAFGLTIFVLMPSVVGQYGIEKIFLLGALFGLVAYGTYDLTNHATIAGWPLILTVVDMAWGSMMSGVSSAIVVQLFHKIFS